jgi:hypothetical protein
VPELEGATQARKVEEYTVVSARSASNVQIIDGPKSVPVTDTRPPAATEPVLGSIAITVGYCRNTKVSDEYDESRSISSIES